MESNLIYSDVVAKLNKSSISDLEFEIASIRASYPTLIDKLQQAVTQVTIKALKQLDSKINDGVSKVKSLEGSPDLKLTREAFMLPSHEDIQFELKVSLLIPVFALILLHYFLLLCLGLNSLFNHYLPD